MACTFGGGGDEDFRTRNNLVARGMMLANPGLIITEPVHQLDQLKIALQGECGIFLRRMKRCDKSAKAHSWSGHFFSSGEIQKAGVRAINSSPPSPISPVPVMTFTILFRKPGEQ